MELLQLIKKRTSTRKYLRRKIPKYLLKKIIEAGIWGPAIHHFQPWKFVVIDNTTLINTITDMVDAKLSGLNVPGFITMPTIRTLKNAPLLILVYNTKEFTLILKNKIKKYKTQDFLVAQLAESYSIAAAIENMVLEAESLGLGSCWLGMPVFCKDKINKLLNIKGELFAVLTLGFPKQKSTRSQRKPIHATLSYYK